MAELLMKDSSSTRKKDLLLLTYLVTQYTNQQMTLDILEKLIYIAQFYGIPFSYKFDIVDNIITSTELVEDVERLIESGALDEIVKVNPVTETKKLLIEPSFKAENIRPIEDERKIFELIEKFAKSHRNLSKKRIQRAIEELKDDSKI